MPYWPDTTLAWIIRALVNSAHRIDPPPPLPKGKTMAESTLPQKIGITPLRQEYFHQYLDLLKNT
jgi:hypothetical protein